MLKKLNSEVYILLALLVVLSAFSRVSFSNANVHISMVYYSTIGYTTNTTGIIITDDSGFSSFPGSGTSTDPYIISNYNISTSGLDAIYIQGTTKYFVVRDNLLDSEQYSISILNVAPGTALIENNTCINDIGTGIYVSKSSGVEIVNNIIHSQNNGIYVSTSPNVTISGNVIYDIKTHGTGIYLLQSEGSTIYNNTITQSNNNYIEGIELKQSFGSTISQNRLKNCGMVFFEDNLENQINYTINFNYINDKPFVYFYNANNVALNDANVGQILLVNVTNAVISGQDLRNNSYAVMALYSHNLEIKTSTFHGQNKAAIWLYESSDIKIHDVSIHDSSDSGLYAKNADTLSMEDCYFDNNKVNVKFVDSSNLFFNENVYYNALMQNMIINQGHNITIQFDEFELGSEGLEIQSLEDNLTLSNCTFYYNYLGLVTGPDTVKGLVLYNNIFFNNTEEAISFGTKTSDSVIYHNSFVHNLPYFSGVSQVRDDGSNNKWYNQTLNEGNYWKDFYNDWQTYSPAHPYTGMSSTSHDLYPLTTDDYEGDHMPDGWEAQYGLNPLVVDNESDKDSDGLMNIEEFFTGTNPLLNDTDGDGLTDILEVATYHTDPNNMDTDDDGLLDGEEVNTYGTNPTNNDTDNDGLIDGHEIMSNTNPTNNDTDDDGLLDGDEKYTYNTNPLKSDTDDDGLTDGDEVNTYNTNPLKSDTDDDGLTDGDEVNTYNTNPLNPDTDDDGYSDGDEVDAGSNPNDPNDTPDDVNTNSSISTGGTSETGSTSSLPFSGTFITPLVSIMIFVGIVNIIRRKNKNKN